MELTVSLLVASTSIMPRRRFWQSGGMKCGMWNTPSFTFSSRFLRLSSSNGRAPCRGEGKRQRVIRRGQVVEREKVWTQKISLCSIEGRRETKKKGIWMTNKARQKKQNHILSLNPAPLKEQARFLNLFNSPIRDALPWATRQNK